MLKVRPTTPNLRFATSFLILVHDMMLRIRMQLRKLKTDMGFVSLQRFHDVLSIFYHFMTVAMSLLIFLICFNSATPKFMAPEVYQED